MDDLRSKFLTTKVLVKGISVDDCRWIFMTAKELVNKLSKVAPDTEIIGGLWNGRVNTYTVYDDLHVFAYDEIFNDFYGTPGAFDDKLLKIQSKEVAYLNSIFESTDRNVCEDRTIVWRMADIFRRHRSKEWKKDRIYRLLIEFMKA